jgi:hypothetical protein
MKCYNMVITSPKQGIAAEVAELCDTLVKAGLALAYAAAAAAARRVTARTSPCILCLFFLLCLCTPLILCKRSSTK